MSWVFAFPNPALCRAGFRYCDANMVCADVALLVLMQSALEARDKIAAPRQKRKYVRRKHAAPGSAEGTPAPGDDAQLYGEEGIDEAALEEIVLEDGTVVAVYAGGKRKGRPVVGRARARARSGGNKRRVSGGDKARRSRSAVHDDAALAGESADATAAPSPGGSTLPGYYQDMVSLMWQLQACCLLSLAGGMHVSCVARMPIRVRAMQMRWSSSVSVHVRPLQVNETSC